MWRIIASSDLLFPEEADENGSVLTEAAATIEPKNNRGDR